MGIAGDILTARKGQLEWRGVSEINWGIIHWNKLLYSLKGKEKGTGACDQDNC